MKTKIKKLIIIFTLTAEIFYFTGCRIVTQPKKTGDDLEGTIKVWSLEEASQALGASAESFMKLHDKVKIEISSISKNEIYSRLESTVNSNTTLPDLVTVENDRVPSLVKTYPKAFLDITADVSGIKDKMVKSKIDKVDTEGKYFAVPWISNPIFCFYRRDILEASGINVEDIKTWDDYVDAGKKILEKSGDKTKLLTLDSKEDTFFRMLLNQLGTGYFDKEGKNTLASPNAIKAMTVFKKIYNSGVALNSDSSDAATNNLKSGTAASAITGSIVLPKLKADNGTISGIGMSNLPAFEPGGKNVSFVGDISLMVPVGNKDYKVVREFEKYLLSNKDAVMKGITELGAIPVYNEYYSEPTLDKKIDAFGGQRILRIFIEGVKDAPDVYLNPDFNRIKILVEEAQSRILVKNEDIKSVMEEISKAAEVVTSK